MIRIRDPPFGFETRKQISNSGGTDMYTEHPYYYNGKYYAKVDGKFIEITKEVAYAMKNFYRTSLPKKVIVRDEYGEVIEKKRREVPFSETSNEETDFSIEDYPDVNAAVEDCVLKKMEAMEVHSMIGQLTAEEKMIIYAIYFEEKTRVEVAASMGVSRQVLEYRLNKILNKMRKMYLNEK